MGISINVTFLLASLIVFWIIPAIGIAKKHLVDKVNPQGWTEKSNFGGFIYE
ncbi:hypothetical protein LL940_10605 [Levilactobacillus brevis]|uniref:hypothetical protein n=1 Tax=Levilactobacillus brevis TaxID=1580 RepID=UPI001C1EA088|nr:hypothetical protein [Levilactobacillus brevis]MBU7558980.1 hypothetical protein [Levilactobacillus brevis]MCE6026024.1 hypothetical protein [Levilactobacillus brevis]